MKRIWIFLVGLIMFTAAYSRQSSITLIADPVVLAVPIKETNEPLIDLRQEKLIVYGPSPEIPDNHDYTYLRKTVYEKLKEAQTSLPKGLRFCVYEGYRSLALQKMLFEKQEANIKRQHPGWSAVQIFNETTKLVSPVVNFDKSHNIPPHLTGGAFDVYLIDEQGEAVDMGIHPKEWMQDVGGKLSLTASRYISTAAQKNRRLMSEALTAVGFVNYPTEYWHWSYGDRYWAHAKQAKHAVYGSVTHHP